MYRMMPENPTWSLRWRTRRNKTYPVVRPLFYYYETKNASKVRPFIDYVMSAEGQATVKKVGYIPVK